MNEARNQALINKFHEGLLNPTEQKEIEQRIESGQLDFAELSDLTMLEDAIDKINEPAPTAALDEMFYQMLSNERYSIKPGFLWKRFFVWPVFAPALAIAVVTLLIGIAIGLFINSPKQNNEVNQLTAKVSELKEMMMINMLEKESASERLKAVSLTQGMDEVSNKVTNALLQTLNTDENVNVRLAALDALQSYVQDDHVRTALIRSIPKQDSPLVQIAFAELMVAIQEKSSVKALEKVLHNDRTPRDVKKKIKESIDVLI